MRLQTKHTMKMSKNLERKATKNIIENINKSSVAINNSYVNRIEVGRNERIIQTPAIISFHFQTITEDEEVVNETYEINASFIIQSWCIDKLGYIINLILPKVMIYGSAMNHHKHAQQFEVIELSKLIKMALKSKLISLINKQ